MDIKLDETMSLALLMEAHMPDNMWQHVGTAEMVMSWSNADTKNTTVQRIETFPICIEDNNSENKEENLTNACFDTATYHVTMIMSFIETMIIVTTNLE